MYNRYIPQADGSYRKRQIPESPPQRMPKPPEIPCSPPEPAPCPAPSPGCSQCPNRPPERRPRPAKQFHGENRSGSVGSFLKNLLPGGFDTEDLLIVLLLLLMSGDCREDGNLPLLTLALYLFL